MRRGENIVRFTAMFSVANKKGMTLVELVVVMAVLSVLAAVAMPLFRVSVKRTKEIELRRCLYSMRDAIDAYKKLSDDGRIKKLTDTGYPKDLDVLVEGVEVTPAAPGQPGAQLAQPQQAGTDWGKTKSIGEDFNPGKGTEKRKFLRKIPVDPMTGKAEWGKRSNADDPDSSIWGEQDVFDVYSLSDGTALDGTKYKDW